MKNAARTPASLRPSARRVSSVKRILAAGTEGAERVARVDCFGAGGEKAERFGLAVAELDDERKAVGVVVNVVTGGACVVHIDMMADASPVRHHLRR